MSRRTSGNGGHEPVTSYVGPQTGIKGSRVAQVPSRTSSRNAPVASRPAAINNPSCLAVGSCTPNLVEMQSRIGEGLSERFQYAAPRRSLDSYFGLQYGQDRTRNAAITSASGHCSISSHLDVHYIAPEHGELTARDCNDSGNDDDGTEHSRDGRHDGRVVLGDKGPGLRRGGLEAGDSGIQDDQDDGDCGEAYDQDEGYASSGYDQSHGYSTCGFDHDDDYWSLEYEHLPRDSGSISDHDTRPVDGHPACYSGSLHDPNDSHSESGQAPKGSDAGSSAADECMSTHSFPDTDMSVAGSSVSERGAQQDWHVSRSDADMQIDADGNGPTLLQLVDALDNYNRAMDRLLALRALQRAMAGPVRLPLGEVPPNISRLGPWWVDRGVGAENERPMRRRCWHGGWKCRGWMMSE